MKKVLGYISVVLLVMSIVSCEDNSLQKRLDDEKDIRVDFVSDQNEASDPDFLMTTTGLYYRIVKENNENIENYENEMTVRDTVLAGNPQFNLKVYWNFYVYDKSKDKGTGEWSLQLDVDGYDTLGDYEPFTFLFSYNTMKSGIYEALGYMKKGDKAEFVIPSTMLITPSYTNGIPVLGIEGQYMSVLCEVRLLDIDITEDPNLD